MKGEIPNEEGGSFNKIHSMPPINGGLLIGIKKTYLIFLVNF
jgi:hypothetical protein